MNKKSSLVFFTLMVGILLSFYSQTANAQNAVSSDKKSVQMTVSEDTSLPNYKKISLLSSAEQKKFFNELAARIKVSFGECIMLFSS